MGKKNSHPKPKLVAETKTTKIKKTPKGAIVVSAKEDDRRSITSRFNSVKNGKRLRVALPTLNCNECPYRPEELEGTGQCKHYKEDSICWYDNKFARLYEGINTRDLGVISELVNEEVTYNLVELNRARTFSGFEGGIPDKITDRLGNQLREWLKFAHTLSAPTIRARQTEFMGKDNNIMGIMKEVYMSGNIDKGKSSDESATFGIKTKEDVANDAIIEMKRKAEQEEADLL